MSANHDLERRITDYYAAETPSRAPDWVLERTLAAVETTQQRGLLHGRPWRIPATPSLRATLGVAVVAIAATGFVGLTLLRGPVFGPAATPSPTASPATSPGPPTSSMWPQSTLEEVQAAQALADAGDPRYAWQIARDLGNAGFLGQHHPGNAEIFPRFLEDVLGWEAFRDGHHVPRPDEVDLNEGDFVYIRCAPGGTNPLYPTDRGGSGCAPTIDELRYETVKINVAQLDRKGHSGIWVVMGWEMIEAEQVAPPSDAEIDASLGAFLRARVDGEGAEAFVGFAEDDPNTDARVDQAIPLLYGTSSGAPYERSEFEVVDGPTWPEGGMQFEVRLFAENGETVVEQTFSVNRDGTGRPRVEYDFPGHPTTENGKAVPVRYGFLDGAVTYGAASPLEPIQDGSRDRLAIDSLLPDDDAPRRVLLLLADPRPVGPGCVDGPAPADAEALARSIGSDPDFEATAPLAVTIGGTRALQMDVVLAPGASSCAWSELDVSGSSPVLLNHAPFGGLDRARLYLLDLPGGSGARVLAMATITDEDSFETVVAAAAPIVDSIEIRNP